MLPQILKDRPLLFWSILLAVFALIAAVVPVEWGLAGDGLLGKKRRIHAFSERVAEIDKSLQEGRAVTLTRGEFPKIRRMLESRRLSRAGGMSQDDMLRSRKMLREMHAQINRESTPGSKMAVQEMWLDRLAEEFPRLDRGKVEQELDHLHKQFDRHVRLKKEL